MRQAHAILFAAVLFGPASLRAQDPDGFLFREPSGFLAVRGGFSRPTAGSDLFSFATRELTLNRGDFSSLDLSVDAGFHLTPRLDLVLSAALSGMSKRSEFRDWMDNSGRPIEQTTNFKRNPVMASVRYYLQPRGRSIGRFAWVPARYVSYVGAGAGMMDWEFDQNGDFIDFATKNVFADHFHSSGWTPVAQVFAGIDWPLGPRWALTTEAKYLSASADLGTDFSGFHRLDLSGFSTSAGFYVRF